MTRRPARRRRIRRQRLSDTALLAMLAAVAAAVALASRAVVWLSTHGWVLLPAAAGAGWPCRYHWQAQRRALQDRGLRYALPQLDALHHSEFEHAVKALLRRDGCRNAVRVGGSGDLGADVTATDPHGRR